MGRDTQLLFAKQLQRKQSNTSNNGSDFRNKGNISRYDNILCVMAHTICI